MSDSDSNALTKAVRRILIPLIRLMLRNGMAYNDFAALAKREFVAVAASDFSLPPHTRSVSRVSVLTGINRKEVKRLMDDTEASPPMENNRAARVITGWLRDEEYNDADGNPKPLIVGNSDMGFSSLVKKYSGDMPARTVLDELVRAGAVTRDDNHVYLSESGYIPSNNNEELLNLSGVSVADLLSTIDHNLDEKNSDTRLQLSVAYDDVPSQSVALFRKLSTKKANEFLNSLDSFLSSQDRSVNPSVDGEGQYRTGIGIYFFKHKQPTEDISSGTEQ